MEYCRAVSAREVGDALGQLLPSAKEKLSCPLVSHGALCQEWARFCAAHIKMKENPGEKQLLRSLKATGFLSLLGRARSQHLALYQISFNKQNIALGTTELAK